MEYETVVAPASAARANETFFSTREFVRAWSRSFPEGQRPLAIPVIGSGPLRTMYGIQRPGPYALYSISLGPVGFYASPGWDGQLERSSLQRILRRLMGIRTRSFVWHVRFDHEPLAAGLASLGLKSRRTAAHVLYLERGYEKIFAGYNATIRNQVRKARRRGVIVRDSQNPDDLRSYYRVHTRLREEKGGYQFVFPARFLHELIEIDGVARFLVAECDGRLTAGALFVRDGSSVFYLHSAYDRDYSHVFPSCAVLNEAIRWACEIGAATFNLGGSGGIASLEQFKTFWGARQELNWTFEWVNPFWAQLARLKAAVTRRLSA